MKASTLKSPLAPSPACFNHLQFLTCPVLEILDCLREDPDDSDRAVALPDHAFDKHYNPQRACSIMISVLLYYGQGIFELLIAAQAPQHRKPCKVRKPTFPQRIPVCVGTTWQFGEILAQERFLPPKENRGSAAIYCSVMTGILLHLAVSWPLPSLAISTRSLLSSLCWYAAGPHRRFRKRSTLFHLLWLRRNL